MVSEIKCCGDEMDCRPAGASVNEDEKKCFFSRKGPRLSGSEQDSVEAHTCVGVISNIDSLSRWRRKHHSGRRSKQGSLDTSHECHARVGANSVMEEISQSANSTCEITNANNDDVIAPQGTDCSGYIPPLASSLTGWMYINENGQICGPYIQEQLYEGLSTGFLPEDLPIYPLVNGSLANGVPLKYLAQYVNQMYWANSTSITQPVENSKDAQASVACKGDLDSQPARQSPEGNFARAPLLHATQHSTRYAGHSVCISEVQNVNGDTPIQMQPTENEFCWMFEDENGRKQGPHSFAELNYWYNSSYLHDSVKIFHVGNKFGPCTLVSLIENGSNFTEVKALDDVSGSEAKNDNKSSTSSLLVNIAEDVSIQLHSGIMKSARRTFLDEIISSIIPEFIASKKSTKTLKSETLNLSSSVKQSDITMEKKFVSFQKNALGSLLNCNETRSENTDQLRSLTLAKDAIHADFFWDLLSIVRRVCFSDCTKLLWNGVFYDAIAHYCNEWRKRKRWSHWSIHLPPLAYKRCITLQNKDLTEQGNTHPKLDFPPGFERQCDTTLQNKNFMEKGNAQPELDFPPGFGPQSGQRVSNAQASDAPNGVSLDEGIIGMVNGANMCIVDFKKIKKRVENELYESARISSFKYFEDIIKVELTNMFLFALDHVAIEDVSVDANNCFSITDNHVIDDIHTIDHTVNEPCNVEKKSADSTPSLCCAGFLAAFEKLGLPLEDVMDDQIFDEPPPGLSENFITPDFSSQKTKFKQINSRENIPTIDQFVCLAIFRQKLYDIVLKDWGACLVETALRQCFRSWSLSKRPINAEAALVFGKRQFFEAEASNDGPRKRHCSSVAAKNNKEKPIHPNHTGTSKELFEKYTYFRRKRSVMKRVGTSSEGISSGSTELQNLLEIKTGTVFQVKETPKRRKILQHEFCDNATSSREAQKVRKLNRKVRVKSSVPQSTYKQVKQNVFLKNVTSQADHLSVHGCKDVCTRNDEGKLADILVSHKKLKKKLKTDAIDVSKARRHKLINRTHKFGVSCSTVSDISVKNTEEDTIGVSKSTSGVACRRSKDHKTMEINHESNDTLVPSSIVEVEMVPNTIACQSNDSMDFCEESVSITETEVERKRGRDSVSCQKPKGNLKNFNKETVVVSKGSLNDKLPKNKSYYVRKLTHKLVSSSLLSSSSNEEVKQTMVKENSTFQFDDASVKCCIDVTSNAKELNSEEVSVSNQYFLEITNDLNADRDEVSKTNISKLTKKRRGKKHLQSEMSKISLAKGKSKSLHFQKIDRSKLRMLHPCPKSDDCARSSINGWEWHKWSANATPSERARIRGTRSACIWKSSTKFNASQGSNAKGLSARTNRAKLRNLMAAAEGAEILKVTQLQARKKILRFQRSKIHDWGLVVLEPIEAEDFVIEYVGELIRRQISEIRERQYEKMGIGSSYLFRLDDGYVVDATKRGGIARFINHSCEPNCYTKIITVDGQKKIFIYAKRSIKTGEEVTYNYKFPLEENKIPCNCGSRRCRGSMN